MAHALFSPSSAHRWINCPGSIAACKDVPSTDNEHSRLGTFAHAIAADALTTEKEARAYIGNQDPEGEFTCDAEMADHVQVYLDAVRSTLMLEGGALLVEQKARCWISAKEETDVHGTADAIIVSAGGRIVHVFDLKYGAGHFVAVDNNPQLQAYAVGMVPSAMRAKLVAVHLHIVQPRHHAGEPWRTATMTSAELQAAADKLRDGVAAARKPDAPLCAGSWCHYCPVKASCPALRGQALAVAQAVFDDRPVAPPTMTGDDIAKILAGADAVESWITAVRAEAFARVSAGKAIPGWKLVPKIGNRKWIDEAKAATSLTAHGVDPWEPRSVISPAQAEKRNSGLKGVVAKLTERPVTGASLVRESDKRPALNPASVFTELPDRAT